LKGFLDFSSYFFSLMILVIAQMTTVIITAYTKKTISPKIKGLLDHPLVIMTKNGIAYITRKKIGQGLSKNPKEKPPEKIPAVLCNFANYFSSAKYLMVRTIWLV